MEGKGSDRTGPLEDKHALKDKTVADVCEALIGAALLSGEFPNKFDMAVKAVTTFVKNSDHDVVTWDGYYDFYRLPRYQTAETTFAQRDLAQQIERKLHYHFRYPRLLRSAFTHPSRGSGDGIPSYQRLEFLGDSLLDLACVHHLFQQYPDADPQWLTEHKVSMATRRWNCTK